jgi:hypothetical protein
MTNADDGALRQVVAKIQDQGLLFGIGVIIIIAGSAGALLSRDVRAAALIIVAVTLIAMVAAGGYYWVQVIQIQAKARASQPPSRSIKGELNAENVSGRAAGVIAPALEGDIEGKANVKNVQEGGTAAGTIVER